MRDFESALREYLNFVEDQGKRYREAHENAEAYAATYETTRGPRYVRVVRCSLGSRSVHSFVDTTNGDILKGSWKAPVRRGVRGNIFRPPYAVTWHGPAYLR